MTPAKLNRAFAMAGITMTMVRRHIERNLQAQATALAGLTGRQLAAVIALHHLAYTQGRASAGAECLDGGPADGLYWLGGQDGVAITMLNRAPVLA